MQCSLLIHPFWGLLCLFAQLCNEDEPCPSSVWLLRYHSCGRCAHSCSQWWHDQVCAAVQYVRQQIFRDSEVIIASAF